MKVRGDAKSGGGRIYSNTHLHWNTHYSFLITYYLRAIKQTCPNTTLYGYKIRPRSAIAMFYGLNESSMV